MKSKLFCLAIATWSVAVYASSNVGYLACVGPAPLRFLGLWQPSTNHFVLPIPVDPEPEAVIPETPKTKPLASVPPIMPPPALAPTVTEARSGPPQQMSEPMPQDGVVSPQMFLKYFSKTTNGTTSIVAPYGFTPPKAVDPSTQGSKATLSSSP
jgi:hypothetical protein